MLPPSESSTSRGNCFEPQSPTCVLSPHSWPFLWLLRLCLQGHHCPRLSLKNMENSLSSEALSLLMQVRNVNLAQKT